MKTTEKNLEEKNPNIRGNAGDKTPALASDKTSPKPGQVETSQNLSKNLANELMGLIKKVNEGAVTPETVNASCNAASQIHKILKLNYEIKRFGL